MKTLLTSRCINQRGAGQRTGYSKAWLYRLIGQKRFPQPVKIGSRSIAFIESEVDEWINQRIAESRSEVV
ncbi:AlpA family transcriptional regulator [Raoultella ornithinolytica]|uniref:helix-turn-helix transcriptional regulator n=1 Tax=Raoultella ornithinolytica TaxID=54291 RepID=UPI0010BE81DF|nr:AlpA family transcriptional regulator [Raoultella ornithinolytica]QCK79179.1 AlpA family transcriptional regulator [Raoultella ornithinolytica]